MIKRRNRGILLVLVALLVVNLFTIAPVKVNAAGKTMKILGGNYELTNVISVTSEEVEENREEFQSEKIKVKKYKVAKGAKLTKIKKSKYSSTRIHEVGNISGFYDSAAKIDGKRVNLFNTDISRSKVIEFTMGSKFEFAYEAEKKNLEITPDYIISKGRTKDNTIVIEVGSGIGEYTVHLQLQKTQFNVDGKKTIIDARFDGGSLYVDINDYAALLSKTKTPITYKVEKGAIRTKDAKKASYKLRNAKDKIETGKVVYMDVINDSNKKNEEGSYVYKVGEKYYVNIMDLIDISDNKFMYYLDENFFTTAVDITTK